MLALRFCVTRVLLMGCLGVSLLTPAHSLPSKLRDHSIFIDPNGNAVDPDSNFSTMDSAKYQNYLNGIFKGYRNFVNEKFGGEESKARMMFFIHGGMNGFEDNITRFGQIADSIETEDGIYPIFIDWNSGFLSSYGDRTFRIRNGYRYPLWAGILTSPLYMVDDVFRVAGGLPESWYEQFTGAYRSVPGSKYAIKTVAKKSYRVLREKFKADPKNQINLSLGHDCRSHSNTFLHGLTYIVAPVKLITAPFVDAIGRDAWQVMLRRSKTLFHSTDETDATAILKKGNLRSRLNKPADGALSIFIRTFEQNVDSSVSITLIGHSMGTIISNQILAEFDELKINTIVYMAAACTVRDFEYSVLPYMERYPPTQFYNLTLHPTAEVRETNAYDLAPRGSLLEWIDYYYNSPQTPLDRTLGKWDNIIQQTHLIPDSLRGHIHLKGFSVETDPNFQGANPQKHGDFTHFGFWRPSFWEPSADFSQDKRGCFDTLKTE